MTSNAKPAGKRQRAAASTRAPAGSRRAPVRSKPAPVASPVDIDDRDIDDRDIDDRDIDDRDIDDRDIDDEDLGEPVPYITASAGRHPAPRLVTILVGLVIVILALSVVFLGRKVLQQNHLNSLRSSALADATKYGGYVSSYDYRNLTAPTSPYILAEQNATPAFRAKLQSVEASFDSALKQLNSTSSGKVVGAGVTSVSTSQASSVLFIQQTTSSSVQKKPVTQPLWLQMTLVRQHGHWLISDITADT